VSDGAGSAERADRVAAYIDGFNLYFGIRKHGRRHLWLDLEGLVRSLLKPPSTERRSMPPTASTPSGRRPANPGTPRCWHSSRPSVVASAFAML